MKNLNRFYRKRVKVPVVCLHIVSAALLAALIVSMLTGQITWSKLQHYTKGAADSREAYLKSEAYAGRVFRHMQAAIRLSWQETIFETNGKLDLDREILKVREEDGSITSYRLGDIVQAEVGGGFEIKPEFRDWEYSGDFWYWQEEEEKRTVDIGMGSGNTAWIDTEAADVIESTEAGEFSEENGIPVDNGLEEGLDDGRTNGSNNESIRVLWFACDRRYPPIYQEPEKPEQAKTIRSGKYQIGWAVIDCLEQYLATKKQLQKDGHNFYYAFTGSIEASNGKTPEEILALGSWYQMEKLSGRYEEEGNLTLFGEQGYNPYYSEKLDTTGYYRLEKEGDRLVIGVDTAFPKEDSFTRQMAGIREEHQKVLTFLILLPIALIGFCLSLMYLIRAAGRTSRRDGSAKESSFSPDPSIRLNFFDKIPFECLLLAGILLGMLQWNFFHSHPMEYYREVVAETLSTYVIEENYLVWNGFWDSLSIAELSGALWFGSLFLNYLFLLAVSLRLLRRKRRGSSCSLLLRGGRWLYQVSRENVKLSWQTGLMVLGGGMLLAGLAFLAGTQAAERRKTVFFTGAEVFLVIGVLMIALIKKAQEKDALLREAALLAEGNLEAEISQGDEKKEDRRGRRRGWGKEQTRKYSGTEKKLAGYLGHIREGMKKAVEAAMKNERMKTELITNVSHDIKTPLTSIINYADLLKRELSEETEFAIAGSKIEGGESRQEEREEGTGGTEETGKDRKKEQAEKQKRVNQYLEVLDQKSKRLKVLTEDLVEASKASSGVLTIVPEKINLGELTAQVNGEFEEKFRNRQLTLVTKLLPEPVYILAEGRRVCRILENLYQNAYKYAMEGTRIYVEVAWEKGEASEYPVTESRLAVFTIKNISAEPLLVSAEELTERFVRGDMARSSEGSGLGLSIAKSLTELQKGSFELSLDGDLFRVILKFPEWEPPQETDER